MSRVTAVCESSIATDEANRADPGCNYPRRAIRRGQNGVLAILVYERLEPSRRINGIAHNLTGIIDICRLAFRVARRKRQRGKLICGRVVDERTGIANQT